MKISSDFNNKNMGFVVLHIDKASGNDSGMTAHIERTIDPVNADK